MHKTRKIRSVVRRCLTVAVAGVLAVSTLQDANAQMCQRGGMGGGGGRMAGGGRGGVMGQGQGAGGAAGMMQMMQMAQQAQVMQRQAMQQQAMFAAMRQQRMRQQSMSMQQLAAQSAAGTQPTRSGRQYSTARRNRFSQSRSASVSLPDVASRAASTQQTSGVSRVSATSTPDSQPQLSGPREFSTRVRRNGAVPGEALPEYVVRLMNRSTN